MSCPNLDAMLGCGFPGFWQLQAGPGHASNRSLYQSKVNQLPGLGSNPGLLQSPGDDAGAGYSSKNYPSPRQVTQSQKMPGAGWEVDLEEVTIPLKMYIGDLAARSHLYPNSNSASVGWVALLAT